ncbi:MAG TPA: Flp pilus assembly protein CpaB [Micromonosporaceae bacterium]|nr:Flp pilus assembly protein CpaB [Micromonosporaceae bacterium]
MRRRMPLILLAALLALLGTAGLLLYVRSADARALAGKQAVTVLVATQRIPAGTSAARIRAEGYVQRVRMPAETVPADTLASLDDLGKLVLTSDVQQRQLVLRGMFGDASAVTDGLAIPKGKVAVTVLLGAPQQVAGYVRPGSKIAVFDTYTTLDGKGRVPAGDGLSRDHNANQATQLLLPRVEVIAVGGNGSGGETSTQPTDAASPGAAAQTGSVLVTVAVTQHDAERLVHAAQTGTLYLALLTESSTVTPGPGVDNHSLF